MIQDFPHIKARIHCSKLHTISVHRSITTAHTPSLTAIPEECSHILKHTLKVYTLVNMEQPPYNDKNLSEYHPKNTTITGSQRTSQRAMECLKVALTPRCITG